jgi:hypothetical protein
VQGLNSPEDGQKIVCLHRLNHSIAIELSTEIIQGIRWTDFESAKQLVRQGLAVKEDFWVFVGYAGWGPGQLQREIDRQSWHIAAAHSSVLLQELINQAKEADTLEAGVGVWEKLMCKIGLKERVDQTRGQFADLTLKEWTRKYLSVHYDSFLEVRSLFFQRISGFPSNKTIVLCRIRVLPKLPEDSPC